MNVNLTLFVQILNFWVAYWILRICIFKPAVRLLYNEEEKKEALAHAIAQEEASIAYVHHKRQLQWQQFRIHCKRNHPIAEKAVEEPLVTSADQESEQVTGEQLALLIASAQSFVVDRLRTRK